MAAALFASAACGSESEKDSGSGTVEIFSWWTGGGEAEALAVLVGGFEDAHPGVAVQNSAVQGGAGTNSQELLRERMESRQPPDLFQIHGGAELIDQWVVVGNDDSQTRMESLNDLYEKNGWLDAYPEELIEIISFNDKMYSLPVGVHRGNVLYANKALLKEHGLKVPTTWDEFFAVGDALKAEGITPLALGSKETWAATHLFEVVLLSTGGPDFYNSFFAANSTSLASADRAKLQEATELYARVLSYTNATHPQLNWEEATDLVHGGSAAMTIMGDWAKGMLVTKHKWKPDVDFDEQPAPGTLDSFIVVTDTFGMPVGAPNRENAVRMLTYLGSAEAQAAFAPLKGCLPARSDVDTSAFDSATQRAAEHLRTKRLVPSLAHGSAAATEFVQSVHAAVADLLEAQPSWRSADEIAPDTDAFVTRLVNSYSQVH